MNDVKNKKLVNGIVLIIGCLLVVFGFISDVFIGKKVLIEDDEEKAEVLFDEKKVITVPKIDADITLENIDFFNSLYNVDVYDGKYFVDGEKLYDASGNLLLETDSYLDYKNGLFRTKNAIYDGGGNLLFDISGTYPVFYDNYFEIDHRFYNYSGELFFDGSNYDNVRYDENIEYIAVEKDGKWGLVNKNNEVILPIEYDIVSIESNTCVMYANENNKGKDIWYVYNIKDKKEYGAYVGVTYLKDNLIIVDKYLTDDLDNVGQWLVTSLCETYILDLNKDTEVLKDMLGDYFISSADFDSIFEDYIIASENYGGYGVFDSNFKTAVPFEYDRIQVYDTYDELEDKYLELIKDNSRKILDKNLNTILEFKEDDILDFYNDLIIKEVYNNISFYDEIGELLYQTMLNEDDEYSYLENGLILFEDEINNTCSYVNTNDKNRKKVNIDYSICDNYWYDDYLLKDGIYGSILFNKDGKRIFKNEYLTINTFDNYCVVSNEKDKYYIINYQEEKLIDMEFSNYESVNDGGIIFIGLDGSKHYFNYK